MWVTSIVSPGGPQQALGVPLHHEAATAVASHTAKTQEDINQISGMTSPVWSGLLIFNSCPVPCRVVIP